MSAETAQRDGLGLGTVLFLIFLVLKLCGVIDWSWWWVTSPLWIPFAVAVSVLIGAIAIGLFLSSSGGTDMDTETTENLCDSCLYRSALPDKERGVYWCAKVGGWLRHPALDCTGYAQRPEPKEDAPRVARQRRRRSRGRRG